MTKLKAFSQEYCQTVEDLPGVGKVVAPSYGLVWRVQQRTRGLGQQILKKEVRDKSKSKKSGALSELLSTKSSTLNEQLIFSG